MEPAYCDHCGTDGNCWHFPNKKYIMQLCNLLGLIIQSFSVLRQFDSTNQMITLSVITLITIYVLYIRFIFLEIWFQKVQINSKINCFFLFLSSDESSVYVVLRFFVKQKHFSIVAVFVVNIERKFFYYKSQFSKKI